MNSHRSTGGDPRPPRASNQHGTPRITAAVRDDRQLVEDCLTQEPAAWTRLYQACHDPLLAAIRSFLHNAVTDANLVDEIAARVWYAVVRNDGEMLSRFDVARGCRLTTFLSVLAKNEARQYFRTERRRRSREEVASRREVETPNPFFFAYASEKEFLGTLTPGERAYYETVLISLPHDQATEQYSTENAWQLRHRVRKKLDQFLESGE